jgi:hypothetical protein
MESYEPIGWWGDESPKWEIVRIGPEPIVVRDTDATGAPQVSIICSGWRFRADGKVTDLADGATVQLVLKQDEGELPCPVEDGFVKIAGFTVGELRGIARLAR